MTKPRLMTGADAAAYCGVTPATFSKWVATGTVPAPLPGTRRWDRKATVPGSWRGLRSGVQPLVIIVETICCGDCATIGNVMVM
jgi:hypothetical protein